MQSRLNVLIVDDEEMVALNTQEILNDIDFQADVVFNGSDALKAFKNKHYDIGLIDSRLPDIQGEELVFQLSDINPETEYLIVTAFKEFENVVKVIKHRKVLGYENKSINPDHLISLLNEMRKRKVKELELKDKEKEIKKLEEYNNLLLESSGDGIIGIDTEGLIHYVNPAAAKMIGYSAEELISVYHSIMIRCYNAKYFDIIGHSDCPIFKAFSDGSIHKGDDLMLKNSSGKLFPVQYSSYPIKDDDENLIGSVFSFQDITERKREEQLQLLKRDIALELSTTMDIHSALEHLLEVVLEIDGVDAGGCYIIDEEKSRMRLVSHRGVSMKYVSVVSEISKDSPIWNIIVTRDVSFNSFSKIENLLTDDSEEKSIISREKIKTYVSIPIFYDSKPMVMLVFASRMYNEFPVTSVHSLESITSQLGGMIARIRAIEELNRLNNELEQRVEERTMQLEKSNENLAKEITIREKIAESLRIREELISSIFDNAQAGICIIDEAGHIKKVNDALCRLLDYTESDLLTMNVSDFFPENFKKRLAELRRKRFREGIHRFEREWRLTKKNGDEIYVYIASGIMKLNNIESSEVVTATDITRLKLAEKEIRDALAQEKELHKLKSSFISMVTHDIKTPLQIILNSSEMLEDYFDRWSIEKRLIHLHRIQDSVKSMNQLLDEVIFIGQSDTGKVELNEKALDMEKFMQNHIEEGIYIDKNKHSFHLELDGNPRPIIIDERVLRHLYLNLLTNAIKYSPAETDILTKIEFYNDKIKLKVIDEGIGISKKDQEHLYEDFHRGENRGSIEGTGLGLGIVKRSVNTLGGEIECISDLHKGTTFVVTLPC